MFEKHKKESPFLSMLGLGGGVGSNLLGSAGAAVAGTLKFALFGGGGSGGAWLGMGGGGGGYVEEDEDFSKGVAYPFSIGAAGSTPGPGPDASGANRGNSGGNTTFTTNSGVFTAYGGGGGGAINPSNVPNRRGMPGGSGGGGFDPASPPASGLGNKVTGTTNSAQTSPPQPKHYPEFKDIMAEMEQQETEQVLVEAVPGEQERVHLVPLVVPEDLL